jgi:hypothetical protein
MPQSDTEFPCDYVSGWLARLMQYVCGMTTCGCWICGILDVEYSRESPRAAVIAELESYHLSPHAQPRLPKRQSGTYLIRTEEPLTGLGLVSGSSRFDPATRAGR